MALVLIPNTRPPQEFIDLTRDDTPEFSSTPAWQDHRQAGAVPAIGFGAPPVKRQKTSRSFSKEEKVAIAKEVAVPYIANACAHHGQSVKFKKASLALDVRLSSPGCDTVAAPNDSQQLLTQVVDSTEFENELERGDGRVGEQYRAELASWVVKSVRERAVEERYKEDSDTETPPPPPPRQELALPAPLPRPSPSLPRQNGHAHFPIEPPASPSLPIRQNRSEANSAWLRGGRGRDGDDADDEGSVQPSSPLRQPRLPIPSAKTTPRKRQAASISTATSPQNYRSRARVAALHSEAQSRLATKVDPTLSDNLYFRTVRKPYLLADAREAIARGSQTLQRKSRADAVDKPHVFHVDFAPIEIAYLHSVANQVWRNTGLQDGKSEKGLWRILKNKKRKDYVRSLVAALDFSELPGRRTQDIQNFLTDFRHRSVTTEAQLLSLEKDDFDKHEETVRGSRVSELLLAREISGNRGYGTMRTYVNFKNEFRKCREDGLELRSEWTNCAGDISTITWTSNEAFICGTTVHSDARNQQYNKFGNLVLGSTKLGTLKAYADHRVVRPLIKEGENSTEAMRQSQDPWLYTSVVSSDYDVTHKRGYTSGFDKSVKIWEVDDTGAAMSAIGTWPHTGNVNFVAASKHSQEMVATAADSPVDAVRVYQVNRHNPSFSTFKSYSCSFLDADNNPIYADKWTYFPAAMRWGLAEDVRHLLLVGYSPRCLENGDDNDIPEDRLNSGEICLWDAITGQAQRITGGTKQNVFEVAWHPSQASFIVASSPVRVEGTKSYVMTQIRIFRPVLNEEGSFAEFQCLDCVANDINELTIQPNSAGFSYITAGCTDGKTYVWDTSQGDWPVKVLTHGRIIEENSGNVISVEDTGVKFTAWGTSPDRFYTGSSDGVVKLWNIRSDGDPLVRDILECPAPVSFGAFSPDFSKLIVGDASGRVFLLSVDEDADSAALSARFREIRLPNGTTRKYRLPNPFVPPPEPAPPSHDIVGNPIKPEETGASLARAYLDANQLRLVHDPTIGAVQGPQYAETGLYRREAHMDDDPERPLLAFVETKQQDNTKAFPQSDLWSLRTVETPEPEAVEQHRQNMEKDFDLAKMDEETRQEFEAEWWEIEPDEFRFALEELPDEW